MMDISLITMGAIGALCVVVLLVLERRHLTYKCPRCGAPMKQLGPLNRLLCTNKVCGLQLTNN